MMDNASKDRTVDILRNIAMHDKRVKIIVNVRNFGHIRSPYHALLQAKGDAVIGIAADLQDPPEIIPQFIKKWEEGYKIVIGVKSGSEESKFFYTIRKIYYKELGPMYDRISKEDAELCFYCIVHFIQWILIVVQYVNMICRKAIFQKLKISIWKHLVWS
jgi:glycosyltransferase involved in cell wall biosynthesis